VARALVTHPALVLADEPTANLDSVTSQAIVELMKRMRDTLGTTFVFSTHDTHLVEQIETVYHLVDGRIQDGAEGVSSDA